MTTFKILGWGLLIAGLLIVIWALIFSYNILTGNTEPPEVFKSETSEAKDAAPGVFQPILGELQRQAGQIIADQLIGILPSNTLPKFLNLVTWSMLAFLLIFGGSQLSAIGINIIKNM